MTSGFCKLDLMFSLSLLSALMLHIWLTLQLVNHGAVNEHNILIHPRNFQYSLDWACYCEGQGIFV